MCIHHYDLPGGLRYNKQRGIMKKCGLPCEVWSRVCGYHRPVSLWNRGKKQEFQDRKNFEVGAGVSDYSLIASSVSTSTKKDRE